ncbi:hypothetical protein B0T26DRAFT_346089 [Lasiosphaeria miniovina]|uniref:Uncharacterized protein n=1 Tax=Lasiosphaeria miniovina TaxID=1954250 RepID=A0AA40ABT9_9PEZI|nr:uncharacterized protein B0T26DRAFT_346089 [Lasiosphaeria miniovina]KAK0712840.1 hypothetical protein B0T26DRAFT_346089 [Lasiosphaeria miniovina]
MFHSSNRMLKKYRLPREQPANAPPSTAPDVAAPTSVPRAFGLRSGSQETPLGPGRNLTPPTDRGSFASTKSTPETVSSSHRSSATGAVPDESPPWDRSVDVFWTRRNSTLDNKVWDDELAFQENCVRLAGESAVPGSDGTGRRRDVSKKHDCRYFRLPDRVRFMIAKYVVASHDSGKAIRLNSPLFFHPVWPVNSGAEGERYWSTDYFDSLGKVLVLLRGADANSLLRRYPPVRA